MKDHEIRLRGGWTFRDSAHPAAAEIRLRLPTRWEPGESRRLRLTRHFGRPARMEDRRVDLRLTRSPGIQSIRLNGRPIGDISPSSGDCLIELGLLEPRNELVLEVLTDAGSAEWGDVTLIFREGSG